MKTNKIEIKETRFKNVGWSNDGREVVRFQPVFTPDICAQGSLTFSAWEVWADEPETFAAARAAAMKNAVAVLHRIAKEFSQS